MRYVTLFLLSILVFGCKKEDKNWEYWESLANKKMEQMIALSKDHTCAEIPNLTLQLFPGICSNSLIIHKEDVQTFKKLLEEYQLYEEKSYKAGRPILYYDILCAFDGAVKIDCKDNKPVIVKVSELNPEEISIEMERIYQEIKSYYNNTPCTNINEWHGFIIMTNQSKEVIPYKAYDYSFLEKAQVYNYLNCRKLKLEQKECTPYDTRQISLTCENNRAKGEFK